MCFAIDFQCNPRVRTVEIENVRPKDLLSAKFVSGESSIAKRLPENSLCRRHFLTKLSRLSFYLRIVFHGGCLEACGRDLYRLGRRHGRDTILQDSASNFLFSNG